MTPTLPRLKSGAAVCSSSSSSSASSAGSKPKPGVIILSSSSDDVQEVSRWKWSPSAGSKPDVIPLSSSSSSSSSDDEQQEASSWERSSMSSSVGSKAGPVVLTPSDHSTDAELLASCRKRRQPCNVAWVFHDEVSILTALAAERLDSGRLPGSRSALVDAIRRRVELRRENPTAGDVAKKVGNLKDRFKKVIASGGPSAGRRDSELFKLSRKVWPELLPSETTASSS